LNAGDIIGNEDFSTQALYESYEAAKESGLPEKWDFLARWGALRAQADKDDANLQSITDQMMDLANQNDNIYAPVILVEASILQYKLGQHEAALNTVSRAEAMAETANNPQLTQQIQSLKTLYVFDDKE
jgi:hypothetical protein